MKKLVFLTLTGLILRLILSIQIYSGDVNNHIAWGKDIKNFGTRGVYSREFYETYGTLSPTYPPIPLFLFTYSYSLFDWTYKTSWKLNREYQLFPSKFIFFLEDQDTLPAFMKIPAIISDLLLAIGVFLIAKRFVKGKKDSIPIITASLVLFNPAFFYNSSYWGQIESIPLVFLIFSFYILLFSKRFKLASILFTLSLLTKQTVIIFIPIFALVLLKKFELRSSIKGFVISLFVFWVFFLPFFEKGNILLFPFLTYWNKIQTGSGSIFVTDHAFNFWALISGLGKIPDTGTWYIFSYRIWGYLMFFILLGFIILKLIRNIGLYEIFFASFLTSVSAFLFLTRMHERYLLQALPFLLLIWVKDKRSIIAFVFLSLFYFINLYHNWWAPRVDILVKFISSELFINIVEIIIIGLFFIYLLKYLNNQKKIYD